MKLQHLFKIQPASNLTSLPDLGFTVYHSGAEY